MTICAKMVLIIDADRQHNARYEIAINEAIIHVQDWYGSRLSGRTFVIDGPAPMVCEVGYPSKYYEGEGGWNRVIEAVQHCAPVRHWSDEYTWVIYIDAEYNCSGGGELGRGGDGVVIVHRGDLTGLLDPANYLLCPDYSPRGEFGWIGGLAHELGHAFGLPHPRGCDAMYSLRDNGFGATWLGLCDIDALMWWGYFWDYPETYLTDEDIAILESSPFIR